MTNMESRNLKLKTVKDGLIDSAKLKNLILEDTDILDGIIDFGNILAKSVMSGNKVVLQEEDILQFQSDTAGSLDAVVSMLEIT